MRRTINVLQAGRAVAALAVVFYHASVATVAFTNGIPAGLQGLTSYGFLGVDFFFVLSGFIIYHTRGNDLRRYARSRLVRIFAPYLPIGIGIAVAYTLLPHLSAANRHWSWLATLTLLPVGQPALSVAWTLQYELTFYVAFGLVFRHPIKGMLVLAAAASVASFWDPQLLLVVEFLFGVLAAKAVEKEWITRPILWAVAAFALYCFLGDRTIFGLTMAFLVIWLARNEDRIYTPRPLIFLGAASYSIYLVHYPVCTLAARLSGNWMVVFFSAAGLGILAGVAYHMVIELPLLKLLRPGGTPAGLEGQRG